MAGRREAELHGATAFPGKQKPKPIPVPHERQQDLVDQQLSIPAKQFGQTALATAPTMVRSEVAQNS